MRGYSGGKASSWRYTRRRAGPSASSRAGRLRCPRARSPPSVLERVERRALANLPAGLGVSETNLRASKGLEKQGRKITILFMLRSRNEQNASEAFANLASQLPAAARLSPSQSSAWSFPPRGRFPPERSSMSTGTRAPGANRCSGERVIQCRSPWRRSGTSSPSWAGAGPAGSFCLSLAAAPPLWLWPIAKRLKKGKGKVLRGEVWKNQECFPKPWIATSICSEHPLASSFF